MLMVGRQIQSIIEVLFVVLWVGSSYEGVNQLAGILQVVFAILYSVLILRTSQYKSMQPKTWGITRVRNHLLSHLMTCFTSKEVWRYGDLYRL